MVCQSTVLPLHHVHARKTPQPYYSEILSIKELSLCNFTICASSRLMDMKYRFYMHSEILATRLDESWTHHFHLGLVSTKKKCSICTCTHQKFSNFRFKITLLGLPKNVFWSRQIKLLQVSLGCALIVSEDSLLLQ